MRALVFCAALAIMLPSSAHAQSLPLTESEALARLSPNSPRVRAIRSAVAALLETLVSMFAAPGSRPGRRAANLGLTALSFLFNWVLTSAAALIALGLSAQPATLMTQFGLPLTVHIVGGIVILDFSASYAAHRAMHLSPFLWRFHRIHHSDPFVDVTTTYRTHPVETLWRFLFESGPDLPA